MSSVCSAVQTIKSGDGSKTQFSFDFPYVFKSEIHVYFWNVTTKEYDEILTTDSTYPWQVPSANPTIVEFTGTAPPAPSDATANIKIRRITNIDDIQALFNPGSAIRSDDLNSNFEQLRFAIQESLCPDITEAEVTTYLQNYYWNNFEDTVTSTDTWSSSDTKIATTAAMDARFQDELAETVTSTETWANDDNTIATTAAIDDQIDNAITNDILIDSTGLTKSSSGGQTTLGIGAGSVDLDRIKSDDIVATSAYSSTWANEDDKVATAGALAARHDVVVNTDVNPPTTTQTGKQWLSTAPGNQVHKIYDGSGWRTVAVGQPYSPATTTVVRYVDVTNGSDASDVTGFLPQAPLQSIGRALELINASSSGDGSLIKVAPGVYQETLPLRIKKNNVSIVGESMRSCFVHPTVATENNDMFEVDSGTYIANLTLLGLKVPTSDQSSRNNSLDNDATYGLPSNQPFSVRFRTDTQPTILKSPYIQNCTHFSDAHFDNANFDPNTFPSTDGQTYSAVAGDESSAPCGGGLLVDGSAVSSSSPIRSMVVDAFTQITLDGPGILVTNNGYAQLVSFFGTFAHYHAKAKNGGQINLSNCVSDFGRYGLIADGKSPSAIATATASAANSGATTITIGAITTAGSFHGTVSRPLDHMMVTIDGVDYGVVSSTANGAGWDIVLTSGLTSNITNTTVSFALRSYISTGGHTFEFVGVGTDYGDHPDNGGVPVEANQVVELNGGKVWQSSTDHVGKFKAGDVLVVDQVSETVDLKATTVTGNLAVTGTVDGRDVAADGTKLDGIETGATADQTAAEIRALVESATDSNVFTDADHTKLNGIAANAIANVVEDTTPQLGGNLDVNGKDIVSVSNGDIDLDPNGSGVVVFKGNSTKGSGQFKLNCENNSHGITIKGPAHSAGANYTLTLPTTDGGANEVLKTDGSGNLSWAAQTTGYSNNSVDAHLNQSTAATNEVLSWNGSDYDWVAQAGGVSDGDKGDITVSGSGATFTIDNGVVSTAKIADDAVTADKLANTAVTAGSYGSATAIPAITVDAQGRITAASTNSFSALINNATHAGSLGAGSTALDSETSGSDNTAFGVNAGTAITTGYDNTLVGHDAGDSITTGGSNTFIGYRVGGEVTTTNGSTAVGAAACRDLTTGTANTAVGRLALAANTTGQYNTAVGYQALDANTTASGGTAVGYAALSSNTTGTDNTAVGYQCLEDCTTGGANVGVGYRVLEDATTASYNTCIGMYAGTEIQTATGNTALGQSALYVNTTSHYNTSIGYNAHYALTNRYNVALGAYAANSLTTGENTIVIGYDAEASAVNATNEITLGNSNVNKLRLPGMQGSSADGHVLTYNHSNGYISLAAAPGISNNTSQNNSLGVGTGALSNESGSNNTAFGANALDASVSGVQNTAVGSSALTSCTSGEYNTALGIWAGYSIADSSRNTYIGAYSGSSTVNTAGGYNTGVGYGTLYNSTAGYNVAVGHNAGTALTTGSQNTIVGTGSGVALTTGSDNVSLGYGTMKFQTTASGNTFVGHEAGEANVTGNQNTFVGKRAGQDCLSSENTCLGAYSGSQLTTGQGNTSIGRNSLILATTGGSNIAIGVDAMEQCTTGSSNVAVGPYSLQDNTTGGQNVAVGRNALHSNTASGNTAVGHVALSLNTTGSGNTAVGYQALEDCSTGYYNTVVGYRVGEDITTGNSNTLVGMYAGTEITTGTSNTAHGYASLYKATTAGSNTSIGANTLYNCTGNYNTALGTSAAEDLTTGSNCTVIGYDAQASSNSATNEVTLGNNNVTKLRIPGMQSSSADGYVLKYNHSNGYISLAASSGLSDNSNDTTSIGVGTNALDSETSGEDNTAFGYDAGTAITSGEDNTAIGKNALKAVSTNGGNTAVGSCALQSQTGGTATGVGFNAGIFQTTGTHNVYLGWYAGFGTSGSATASFNTYLGSMSGYSSSSGGYNVGIGYQTLYNNTSGAANHCIGYHAGRANTTGTNNVFIGYASGYSNTTHSVNTYIGDYSGYYALGNGNVAIGYQALQGDSTATANRYNVAVGNHAGEDVTSGYDNTLIGWSAGSGITTGYDLIVIGKSAAPSSNTTSGEITLGSSNISTLRCNTQTISSLSDGRDKTEVEDLPLGLDFIDTLRPVKFKWDTRDGNGKDGTYDAGFIAQDLQSAQSASDAEYLKMVMDSNPDRLEAAYGQLIPVLVQAIKDLKSEIETLKSNV